MHISNAYTLSPHLLHWHPRTPTVVKTSCNLFTSVIRPGSFTLILCFPSASTSSFTIPVLTAYAHALGFVCAMFLAVSPGDGLSVFAYLDCARVRRRCTGVPEDAVIPRKMRV